MGIDMEGECLQVNAVHWVGESAGWKTLQAERYAECCTALQMLSRDLCRFFHLKRRGKAEKIISLSLPDILATG